ncbi:MAG: serine protease [Thermoplasmata archaeon]|nr:serine protease [Thermoplasmata archaeon]
MFAEACSRVSEFTRPLVVSTRQQDGTVVSEFATMVVLNSDGWVMTAGHVYDSFAKYQTDLNKAKEIAQINESRQARQGAPSPQIRLDPTMLTNHSFWWGWDGVRMTTAHMYRQLDIVVGKLEPFNPDWVREYPVLRDPESFRPGTSVCVAGYAFMNVNATWDEPTKSFRLPRIPQKEFLFYNSGIFSRRVGRGVSANDGFEVSFVETSCPGCRGQSGGPIFDTEGRVCALQSCTEHLPLGFHPTVEFEGTTTVEHQFLNLGRGLHVGTIRSILDKHGIRYDAEGDESGFRIVG